MKPAIMPLFPRGMIIAHIRFTHEVPRKNAASSNDLSICIIADMPVRDV